MNDTPSRAYLNRKEAASYLSTTYFPISVHTLARYASDNIGPEQRRAPGLKGGKALYLRVDLDAWAKSFPVKRNDDGDTTLSPSEAERQRHAGALSNGAKR